MKKSPNSTLQMAFGFGVEIYTKAYLSVPWQGLKNLFSDDEEVLGWRRISKQGIDICYGHQAEGIGDSRPRLQSGWPGDANSFSLDILLTPFLRAPAPLLPATLSPTSGILPFISERLCFPLSWAHTTLSLCTKACLSGTLSTEQTAKVGIQQRAGGQAGLTFLDAFQRL